MLIGNIQDIIVNAIVSPIILFLESLEHPSRVSLRSDQNAHVQIIAPNVLTNTRAQ